MNKIFKVLFLSFMLSASTIPLYGEKVSQDIITLPEPDTKGSTSLEFAILNRRSVRAFSPRDITAGDTSQLLWALQGVTGSRGYRSAPSAGALYPLEVYIVKKDGLFKYIPDGHKVRRVSNDDLRGALERAAFSQSSVGSAPLNIVICAVYNRVTSRYGDRGIRYTDIEVGHAAQNVHLQAIALGLDSVPIGAFNDNAVSKLLSLPEDETPLYIIPVGYKK